MKICGIIAEYNPFHKGHQYQIEETRRRLGGDTAIVCVLSGDYVQRGEAAVMDKNRRAEAAVRCGADLVLSLPLRWSLSSAPGFADGAVHILRQAGCDFISFGAEDDDLQELQALAGLIAEKSVEEAIIARMDEGMPYAIARERELYSRIREKAELIRKPNNILAVEYLRAIRQQEASMIPIAVKRTGAEHDGEEVQEGIASASYIRTLIRDEQLDRAEALLPAPVFEMLVGAEEEGRLLWDLSRLDCALTAVLRRMDASDFAKVPGAAEGLEHRLAEAVRKGRSFEEMCALAKTKRYAHSRIRRMLYSAFLGIEKQDRPLPPFTRVLAFNDRGRAVLSRLESSEDFTFLTKPAAAKALPQGARAAFELEAKAADAYDLALPAYGEHPLGREWTKGPVYIKE